MIINAYIEIKMKIERREKWNIVFELINSEFRKIKKILNSIWYRVKTYSIIHKWIFDRFT